ncbi:cupin domain-containing protein [Candidatus Bipolaricaulota bacterium]|nr:cupin domain-containing protein [Candidatus Bipolaricaulota bacterium]
MVLIGKSRNVEPRAYHDGEKVLHVEKRVLVGPKQGVPSFSMRKFTVAGGGCSPYHTHGWEHEVYVLSGKGEVRFAGGSQSVEPGDFAYVPPNDEHQFVNAGEGVFEFLCMVPLEGEDG